jgi:cytochrome c oxidase subunit III
MSRLTSAASRDTGNGAFLPPRPGGGGGGPGDEDHSRNSLPNYGHRLRQARLGLAVAMTPIFILFVTFTAVYLIRRGFVSFDTSRNSYIRDWVPVQLPWLMLFINTGILLASSITIELARRAITREAALAPVRSIPGVSLGEERHFPWLALSTVLGVVFLAGQLVVWKDLSSRGFHLTGGTSSSFVYVLTAMHGLHLAGGVLALLFANVASWLHRNVENRRIIVDISSWYWHCMTGIWLLILLLFSFAAQ